MKYLSWLFQNESGSTKFQNLNRQNCPPPVTKTTLQLLTHIQRSCCKQSANPVTTLLPLRRWTLNALPVKTAARCTPCTGHCGVIASLNASTQGQTLCATCATTTVLINGASIITEKNTTANNKRCEMQNLYRVTEKCFWTFYFIMRRSFFGIIYSNNCSLRL